jgi:type IV pilus assembly protein PilY1
MSINLNFRDSKGLPGRFRSRAAGSGLRLRALVLSAALCLVPGLTHANPGTISDAPLFVSTIAEPNIMLLFDSSYSMLHIVPSSHYDSENTYLGTCPVGNRVSTTQEFELELSWGGSPRINYNGTNYEWGTGSGQRCFVTGENYKATLTTANPGPKASYNGNVLNWYFDTNTDPTGCSNTWSSGRKPCEQSRLTVAQEAATDLVNTLNNVRFGLATYNDKNGATIKSVVAPIASNRATLVSTIAGIQANGMTPLAESLHDIGRYFVGDTGSENPGNQNSVSCTANGQYAGSLTLHPDTDDAATKDDGTVFNHTPSYDVTDPGSPICYFCQKNFVLILTDGRPTYDRGINDNSGLTDYDGDCTNQAYVCDTYDRKPASEGYSYEADWIEPSDYLDDVAKALYEMDLRPDINDLKGNAVKNNLMTYTIGFADQAIINDPLMQDTADNGGGEFKTAADATSLVTAFQESIDSILGQTGSASAVSFNSTTLGTDTSVYLALFDTDRWSGDLIAYPLDGITGAVGTTAQWHAASKLDDRDLSTTPRTILTYNAGDGVPFTWTTVDALTTGNAIYNDLSYGAATGTEDTVAHARLDYIRGDREDEGTDAGDYRVRDSRLGDIVHSTPVYVGEPIVDWPDGGAFPDGDTTGQLYSVFRATNKSRTGIVYVGANDGMLHGFNAASGEEVLAYIPSSVYSSNATDGLHYLTNPDYSHQFYVDMSPTISDAYIRRSTTDASPSWTTVLLGSLGAGGKGLFALDITNPANFSEDNAADLVLWEFTHANLGYTFSKPVIALMENGRWAAIFGNGYNNGGDGKAKLFVVFLEGGLDGTWTLTNSGATTDYVVIDTGVGSTTDKNGLSTPAVVDTNGDGQADRVYAGDLAGNLWAFDLTAESFSVNTTTGLPSTSNGWRVAYKSGNTPTPLFSGNSGQPITTTPVVIDHPSQTSTGNGDNLMIYFGTGQYLTATDVTQTPDTQSFYGIWDHGTGSLDRSDLVEQQIIDHDEDSAVPDGVRVMTTNEVSYGTGDDGWYIDLDQSSDTGERVVVNATYRGSNIYFNTLVSSTVPCSAGGYGWLMAVDAETGGAPEKAAFDYNGDNIIDDADYIEGIGTGETDAEGQPIVEDRAPSGTRHEGGLPAESSFLGDRQYTTDTATESGEDIEDRGVEKLGGTNTGRLSWEELFYGPGTN